ncbi:MAG: cytochrome c oxidase subunit II [Rhodospirillales bacterium]
MLKRLVLSGAWALSVWALGGASAPARAQQLETVGIAKNWQMGFQEPASPVMERIASFHDLLLILITLITLFVLGLLIYVAVRFNEKANPTPSTTSHNTVIEIIWTAVPIIILIIIAVPSFKLLYYMDRHDNPDMTIKVTGNQWYWTYEYEGLEYDSLPVADEDLQPGQVRMLSVDNPLVLPVETNIRVLQTSNDVIHNWAVPAFGLKLDSYPGRINENWVRITKEGIYYGQCSELCGVNHSFMPIEIHAVSKAAYQQWLQGPAQEFAKAGGADGAAAQLAMSGE